MPDMWRSRQDAASDNHRMETGMPGQVTNFARFYSLLKLMPGMDKEELKEQLVSQWTQGRTVSLREMTEEEYHKMCGQLDRVLQQLGIIDKDSFRAERRYRRSVCLRLMQKTGVDTSEWKNVDSFCKSPKIAGKVFRDLSLDELDEMSLRLRMILKKQRDK